MPDSSDSGSVADCNLPEQDKVDSIYVRMPTDDELSTQYFSLSRFWLEKKLSGYQGQIDSDELANAVVLKLILCIRRCKGTSALTQSVLTQNEINGICRQIAKRVAIQEIRNMNRTKHREAQFAISISSVEFAENTKEYDPQSVAICNEMIQIAIECMSNLERKLFDLLANGSSNSEVIVEFGWSSQKFHRRVTGLRKKLNRQLRLLAPEDPVSTGS